MGDVVTANRVDPAALLIAVLAVGVGPLTESGPWEPINTIIGCAVLLIILPYAFAKQVRGTWLTEGPRLPVAVAVAFIVGVSTAWPIQTIWHTTEDKASYLALGVAAGVALAFWASLTILAQLRHGKQVRESGVATDPAAG
jgi:hypothetical protein